MNEEKKGLMAIVENSSGTTTIKDWATAAKKLADVIHSVDESEKIRLMRFELSHKSMAIIQMWKDGLNENTPYKAIEKILHSDWMLRHSMEKNENKAIFTFNLFDFS
ncbi:hypothetical protein [Rheinheimera soli]|uniref:Uncharacterized protein n=1 Tax=Rheinheimera soli TaxID=443616 RepID=A0ABU1VVJ3_9GAMM|nr:hypothetical protein [Rheinheimera soli]MDR7119746.1 hypothetical protein [Rheinheimera soli]